MVIIVINLYQIYTIKIIILNKKMYIKKNYGK